MSSGSWQRLVEECRAFLVANYLADNKDILALFGYDKKSTPVADYRTFFGLRIEREFD